MGLFDHLALGFSQAVTLYNLSFCLLGVFIGTLIGVLPGIGPVATLAMLLPLTFAMQPLAALIMLAGIYYGAQYGGSTTAILVNLPGEASSVVTCIDGYQMARQGRAGAALAVAALGSFFAGTVATLFVAAMAPILAEFSLRFRSPEFVVLMIFGLLSSVVLARGSALKAVGMVVVGLLFGLVGTDVASGTVRFAFGNLYLSDGVNFVALALGLFGVAEIIANLEENSDARTSSVRVNRLWPSADDWRRSWPAALRGTALGSVLGLVPGGGATLSSFGAYMIEKRIAREPERFGAGAVEGVAAPESANNAAAQTSFVPLLMFGIPSTAVMALMMGAMMVHGMAPGTIMLTARPDLFWGLIASMWLGNLMLLVINLPLLHIWVMLLRVPYRMLFPAILLFCCIGVYSIDFSLFDIVVLTVFSAAGYVLRKVDLEGAPLLLGFVLGPLLEEHLRRALLLSDGSVAVFVQRPISLTLLILGAVVALLMVLPRFRKVRDEAFEEST